MKKLFCSVFVLLILVSTSGADEQTTTREKRPKKNIVELESELQRSKDSERIFYIESDIVKTYASAPIPSTLIKNVKSHAVDLLSQAANNVKNWNYGNAIHHANLVLGRISLIEGKTEEAKKYLEAASKTPGSPQLNSFGPNMTLAKELLEKKEKDVVLKYLQDCSKFWKPTGEFREDLERWKIEIAQGKIPDFKGSLTY